ncbi:hypothetical protein Hanom_Chr00s131856g01815641 [Helianthus anomalus]
MYTLFYLETTNNDVTLCIGTLAQETLQSYAITTMKLNDNMAPLEPKRPPVLSRP